MIINFFYVATINAWDRVRIPVHSMLALSLSPAPQWRPVSPGPGRIHRRGWPRHFPALLRSFWRDAVHCGVRRSRCGLLSAGLWRLEKGILNNWGERKFLADSVQQKIRRRSRFSGADSLQYQNKCTNLQWHSTQPTSYAILTWIIYNLIHWRWKKKTIKNKSRVHFWHIHITGAGWWLRSQGQLKK